MNQHALAAALVLGLAACGDESGGNGGLEPESPDPTIRVQSPICLNQQPFPIAGVTQRIGPIITNFGEATLVVRGARIVEEDRPGAAEIFGLQDAMGPCTTESPCRLEFREDAVMAVDFTPESAGWDRIVIEVDSNDPLFQADPFRFAIVSAAQSAEGAEDFGDRPANLNCVCRTPVPPECQN